MKYAKGTFTVVPNREYLRGLPPATQALYFWLCTYADEAGECYPSRNKLAKDIGGSVRTVDAHLQKLEEVGLIEKEHRIRGNEKQSNLYQLLVLEGSADIAPPPRADFAPPSADIALPRANIAHRTITRELQTKELKNIYGEHENVKLTDKQYHDLAEQLTVPVRDDLIEQLSRYLTNTRKRYSNHYATIQTWHRKKQEDKKPVTKTFSLVT